MSVKYNHTCGPNGSNHPVSQLKTARRFAIKPDPHRMRGKGLCCDESIPAVSISHL